MKKDAHNKRTRTASNEEPDGHRNVGVCADGAAIIDQRSQSPTATIPKWETLEDRDCTSFPCIGCHVESPSVRRPQGSSVVTPLTERVDGVQYGNGDLPLRIIGIRQLVSSPFSMQRQRVNTNDSSSTSSSHGKSFDSFDLTRRIFLNLGRYPAEF
ncbi:unnamed protein product [Calypogeia fissa]